MRLAFVQKGAGLEPAEVQLARLKRLQPDMLHIEAAPTVPAAKRLIERLERLGAGDTLCLASLDALGMGAGDLAGLLAGLLGRGVRCLVIGPDGDVEEFGKSSHDKVLLDLLASVRADGKFREDRRGRGPEADPEVLSSAQIDEIRQLHQSGVSLRQIGLAFRRSPNCIARIVNARETGRREAAARVRRVG